MHTQAAFAAGRGMACVWAVAAAVLLAPLWASAQDEQYGDYGGGESEPSFSVNGMMRVQGGLFVPLPSNKFEPHENIAFRQNGRTPCDVRQGTGGCVPRDHGQDPGSPSIARATLQLEAQWDINEYIGLHAIVRGVRSLKLKADRYARVPRQDVPTWREENYEALGEYAEDWVHDNYYTELDLREFYLDLFPMDWLSMRVGRQQIMWGDIGGYRLLDAVNPENAVWHFAPLEAVEDIRIPLWMWLTTIDLPSIEHSLDLLWVPMIDRPKDTVSTPLTFGGAWGVPWSNSPTSFYGPNTVFHYPGEKFKDMRAGLRWKGNIGEATNYSLVYLYTHQFAPAIPRDAYYAAQVPQTADPDTGAVSAGEAVVNNTVLRVANVIFPRQHIAGFSLEHNISPISSVARLEAAVEPNRTYSGRADRPIIDPNDRFHISFDRKQLLTVNYAVQLQRPTMIRFLNPTQNFLLVAQFFHSVIPTLDMNSEEGRGLVNAPTFNLWQLQKHVYRVAGIARTSYLHGKITLGLMAVYMPNPYAKDSGFYSIDVGFRLGAHYRLNIVATDFIGKDPYRDFGLYRDRDEIAANFSVLF